MYNNAKPTLKQWGIISKKIDQLYKIYDHVDRNVSIRPRHQQNNDILILMRYCMSLEGQVRQLREDVEWLRNGQVGPRPIVQGVRQLRRERNEKP